MGNLLNRVRSKTPPYLGTKKKRNSQKCGFFSFKVFTPIFIFSKFKYKNKKNL